MEGRGGDDGLRGRVAESALLFPRQIVIFHLLDGALVLHARGLALDIDDVIVCGKKTIQVNTWSS